MNPSTSSPNLSSPGKWTSSGVLPKVLVHSPEMEKVFSRGVPIREHVAGLTPHERKIRAIHGNLSFHPIRRVESAKERPNLPGTGSVMDRQFGAAPIGSMDPADFRNRDHKPKIDIGYEHHEYRRHKPTDDPFNDRNHEFTRLYDHNFSDIFHNKYVDASSERAAPPNRRKPVDYQ